jgi:signal recognition particle receptor subunit beta
VSLINPLAREISAKIVYYGAGLSGKTTSLKYVHEAVRPERRGQLLTLATEGDRTIFFDFLPLYVKQVQGMGVRFQLYTVPGQVFYEATRRLVLNGADGVVFVADSQRQARDSNLQSFENLREHLADMGIDIEKFPLVIQYNKRDLPDILSIEQLRADVNPLGAPEFETNAATGVGILEALKEISGLVIRSLWNELPKNAGQVSPDGEYIPSDGLETSSPRSPDTSIVAELQRLAEIQRLAETSEHVIAQPVADIETEADVQIAHPPTALPPPIASPEVGLSFTPLWEGADALTVGEIEDAIQKGANKRAIQRAANALARLLESLPGTLASESPMAKAALLGLDGREYLRFCRLVTLPESAISERDALFALYMLISAKIKAQLV